MKFKRKPYVRPPRAPLVLSASRPPVIARMVAVADEVVQVPKRAYVRSPALMKAYRMICCQNCGRDDGTVCGAHSNWAVHGKGRGIKADDNRCASLCFTCHTLIDQGGAMSEFGRRRLWWRAHQTSVQLLVSECLWPADVPVPPVLEFPKEWS